MNRFGNVDNVNWNNYENNAPKPPGTKVIDGVIFLKHTLYQAKERGVDLRMAAAAVKSGLLVTVEYNFDPTKGVYHVNKIGNDKAIVVYDPIDNHVITLYPNGPNETNWNKYNKRKSQKQHLDAPRYIPPPQFLNEDTLTSMYQDKVVKGGLTQLRLGTRHHPDYNVLRAWEIDGNLAAFEFLARSHICGVTYSVQDRVGSTRKTHTLQSFIQRMDANNQVLRLVPKKRSRLMDKRIKQTQRQSSN